MRVIAGSLRSRRFEPPRQAELRPLTDRLRESLFGLLEHRVPLPDARVLDLFSGSGSFSYEALSRGAASSLAIETSPKSLSFIHRTARDFGLTDRLQARRTSVQGFLCSTPDQPPFDLIMLDPPYRLREKTHLIQLASQPQWLAEHGWLLLHHPAEERFTTLPGFVEERNYGGAHLSLFRRPQEGATTQAEAPLQ